MSRSPLVLLAFPAFFFGSVAEAEPEVELAAETPMPLAVVPRDPATALVHDQRPAQLGSKVLFVNFDGVQLNNCGNNSPLQNCSTIFGGTVLPYSGDDAKRASIIQTVRNRVEDFGITVTTVRPASGDYDMEVVGNWQGVNPSFAGIAPGGDCWDNGGGEVSFTLDVAGTTDGVAEIILQELAHTWGLDHVDDNSDLLYPTTEGVNKMFRDECFQVVADTDLTPTQGFCGHHAQACGSNSLQNSYQEMLLIFGVSTPDTISPTAEILSPAHGDIIDGDFTLTVALSDDQTPAILGTRIRFESDALEEPVEISAAYAGPTDLNFPVTGLPNGDYDITVSVEDESDNMGSDTITIRITGSDVPGNDDGADDDDSGADDDDSGGDGGGNDDADGDGGGNDDGGSNDGGDGTGSDTEGAGASGDGEASGDGCAIPVTPRGPGHISVLLLVLFGLGRRRRAGLA